MDDVLRLVTDLVPTLLDSNSGLTRSAIAMANAYTTNLIAESVCTDRSPF